MRKEWHIKSKKDGSVTSQQFVCFKEGFWKPNKKDENVDNPCVETKTGCMARLGLTRVNRKFRVQKFVERHNRELYTIEISHILHPQRKISEVQAYEIELTKESGFQQKASFDLMCRHEWARANLGYTSVDANNYLRQEGKETWVIWTTVFYYIIFISNWQRIHHFFMPIRWIQRSKSLTYFGLTQGC